MLKAEMFNLNGGEFINLEESEVTDERYVIKFKNGYGVDICSGELYHCDKDTYEVGIVTFKYDGSQFYLADDIEDNIFDYQTTEDIQELIDKVSEIPEKTLLN